MKTTKALPILLLVSLFIYSCSSKKNENSEENKNDSREIAQRDSNYIQFPYIYQTGTELKGNILEFTFVDSMPFYNAVMSNQAVFIYALQSPIPQSQFDSVVFLIRMPKRENPKVRVAMGTAQFTGLVKNFTNPQFKDFLKEILRLNYNTSNRYKAKYSSILDGLNMIFAAEIESKYKDQFPNNSTFFGYNSFLIFGKYFSEVNSGTKGIGHKLIDSIKDSKENLITEYDKMNLNKVIKKYDLLFKPKVQ